MHALQRLGLEPSLVIPTSHHSLHHTSAAYIFWLEASPLPGAWKWGQLLKMVASLLPVLDKASRSGRLNVQLQPQAHAIPPSLGQRGHNKEQLSPGTCRDLPKAFLFYLNRWHTAMFMGYADWVLLLRIAKKTIIHGARLIY